MSDEGHWFYCLKHMRVEYGPGCPNKDRMGPYDTEDRAKHALEHARERNEAWDAEDADQGS
ncbi:hypothetical protein LO762_17820 [Actinocorallia sp. API 0066]|uniref:hypothetical protein n=1 Tax=Actinocorallia sp. API 0066 TaxID=2896846 RepID=UPI001E4B069A|nr:hypothetical protein [Actinocorallia sp. API 0066]MCD0451041.1 hypothetical protein [Actinocorallia sp. API 0066]